MVSFNILIHEMLMTIMERIHNVFPFITIILRDGYWETLKSSKVWATRVYWF